MLKWSAYMKVADSKGRHTVRGKVKAFQSLVTISLTPLSKS